MDSIRDKSIIAIAFTMLFTLFASCLVSGQQNEVVEFVYNGTDSVELNIERDSIYADGADPYGVYSKSEGIMVNDTMAVEYAKLILFQIYGKEQIEKQRPYSVRLLNGTVWSVTGNLRDDMEGGVFSVMINKADGRVLMVSHSK
ncbi:MAG: YbbC/YhhH family protein [Prevotella sp.]|nr:YbbC/YhhH family protein [Prevotella sp.]MBR5749495.1 YbbC/YhhH family protein [Prevotella sp.]